MRKNRCKDFCKMLLRRSDWDVCKPTVQTRQFRYRDRAENEGHACYHGTFPEIGRRGGEILQQRHVNFNYKVELILLMLA